MADKPTFTLTQARELVGLTPSKLARESGLTPGDIYDLETGRNGRPSWQVVGRVVQALRANGLPGLEPEQIWPLVRDEKGAA